MAVSRVAIQAAVAALTGGYVLFPDSNGLLTGDSNFFWDNTNKRLGIGTTSPAQILSVVVPNNTTAPKIQIGQMGSVGWNLGLLTTSGNFRLEIDGGQAGIDVIRSGLNIQYVNFPNGSVGIGTSTPTSKLQVVGLPVYANNAAAVTGGLSAGAFYRTGSDPDTVCVVH